MLPTTLDDPRLQAPLVPLKHVALASSSSSSSTHPRAIPRRPAHRPASAPFGESWRAQHGGWTCETSVFPAAYPRSIASGRPATTTSTNTSAALANNAGSAPAKMSKEDLGKAVQAVFDKQRQARQSPPNLNGSNGPNPLWIAVNRYTNPTRAPHSASSTNASSKDPVTLVFAHANGFSKEVCYFTVLHVPACKLANLSALADLGTDNSTVNSFMG